MTETTDFKHVEIPFRRSTADLVYSRCRRFIPKIFRARLEQAIYHIRPQAFDGCFSLGNNCLSAIILKEAGLRQCSGPFDWLGGPDFFGKAKLITTKFDGMLDRNNLEYTDNVASKVGTITVNNKALNFAFIHDFKNTDETEYKNVIKKYHRRQDRFLNICKNGSIMLLYIEHAADKKNYQEKIKTLLNTTSNIQQSLNCKALSIIILIRNESDADHIDAYYTNNSSVFTYSYSKNHIRTAGWVEFSPINCITKQIIGLASHHLI